MKTPPEMPLTNPSVNVFGEIQLCQFPFTSGVQGKVRPALVLFDLGRDAIISRITSAIYSGPLDLLIRDWQQAGLLAPSTVRLARLVTAEKTLFIRRLGSLSPADAAAIRAAWNQHMKL